MTQRMLIYVFQPGRYSRGELAHWVEWLPQKLGFGQAAFAVPEVIRASRDWAGQDQ